MKGKGGGQRVGRGREGREVRKWERMEIGVMLKDKLIQHFPGNAFNGCPSFEKVHPSTFR